MIKAKNGEILVHRKTTVEDLPQIEKLAEKENYNVGLHNLKLFFECSPDQWEVIVNGKGEVVAYSIFNKLEEINLRFGYGLIVRKDYEGQGLTRHFETMHYSKSPSMGNASNDSVKRYKYEICGEKFLGYFGIVPSELEKIRPATESTNFTLSTINETDLQDVIAYDTSVILFNRGSFVSEWITAKKYPCKTVALVSHDTKNGHVTGYGVVREFDQYYMIAPVYADNDHVAEWLFYRLLKSLSVGDKVYIFFPAKSRTTLRMASILKFNFQFTELRESASGYRNTNMWDIKNVYAMHDYFPF